MADVAAGLQEVTEAGITVHVGKLSKSDVAAIRKSLKSAASAIAAFSKLDVSGAKATLEQGKEITTKQAAVALDEIGVIVGYNGGRPLSDGSQSAYLELREVFVAADMSVSAINKARSDLRDAADPSRVEARKAAKEARQVNGATREDNGPTPEQVVRSLSQLSPVELVGILADLAIVLTEKLNGSVFVSEDVVTSGKTSVAMLGDAFTAAKIGDGTETPEPEPEAPAA